MRRLVSVRLVCVPVLYVIVALFAVMTPARALATVPPNSTGGDSGQAGAPPTTIDNSFLDTKRELSECLNDSIGLPDCGIEPTQPGDRGGVLQGVTFGVLALGIALICWRVVRSVKARDAAVLAAAQDR
jgi:hypothetical protein